MTIFRWVGSILRSPAAGWAIAALAVIIGVPLFIRMPPWCDLTLYDVAAHEVIAGGVHFRDVFDTNLPGFLWCLIAIRRLFGDSTEVVRIIDLAIMAACAWLLARLLRQAGAARHALAWFAAGLALWYPFTGEFSHCQRDTWMTLPILLAVALRIRHLESPAFTKENVFRQSLMEGTCWAVGVWFKPHVLLIAAAIWLATFRYRRRQGAGLAWADFRGNFIAGAAVALLGIAALVATGTWPHFVEVFTKWNDSYILAVWRDVPNFFARCLNIFPPWTLLCLPALPLAVRDVWRLLRDAGQRPDPVRLRIGMVSLLYLVVMAQAIFLQRNFDYVHVPETLLMFAVLAWHVPLLLGGYILAVLASTLLAVAAERWGGESAEQFFFRHRIAKLERTARWAECFRGGLSPVDYRQRQWALSMQPEYHSTINPVELGEVADWLRQQGVGDGEVIGWHDTPHALYLELGIRPKFRFMHISTTFVSMRNYNRMTIELHKKALPHAKYIVSDLLHTMRVCEDEVWERRVEAGPDLLPPDFSPDLRESFPYNQPAVFRSNGGRGRYIIHRIEKPIGRLEFEVVEPFLPVKR